jgi:phosphoribosylaminoimidazole-succinocarboxamide synthase
MTILVEGKTKLIQKGDKPFTINMIAKDFLTGGDAAKKEELTDIGIQKTIQASNVFKMLEYNDIPTSFIELTSPNTMLHHECDMLPLEFVVRRYAYGSYLKRNPQYKMTNNQPHSFTSPVWEVFHKHSVVMPPNVNEPIQIDENEAREKYLIEGKWAEGVYTDPYIEIENHKWILFSAKDPIEDNALMETESLLNSRELGNAINRIVIPSFEAIEKNWRKISTVDGPVHLVDIKFELGFRAKDNLLVLSDVVDNDSWRIWPGGNPENQLDKQSFRDGEDLSNVANKYQLVTELTKEFFGASSHSI